MPDARTVAILIDYLSDYQARLLCGMQKALRDAQLGSITYVGRGLTHQDLEAHHLDMYGLIQPENHCGVLVSAASISSLFDPGDLEVLLQSFHPLPVVCAGISAHGHCGVTVDHQQGMEQLMHHLTTERGFRRFVFMGGLEGNPDSQIRERVVREHLKKHGLSLTHHLRGDFFAPTAREQMKHLLSHTRDFEVVVCASDEMAFGVMEALHSAGLEVGRDVAVTGFDDVEFARFSSPPLTTVQQPTEELGRLAAQLLVSRLQGHHSEPQRTLGTRLVVRESSGGTAAQQVPADNHPVLDRLQATLLGALRGGDERAFFAGWNDGVHAQPETDQQSWSTQLMLNLQARLLPGLDEAGQKRLTHLLQQAHQQTSEVQHLQVSRQYHQLRVNVRLANRLELALSSHRTLQDLRKPLQDHLQWHGLTRYGVVLYDEPTHGPAHSGHLWLSGGLPHVPGASFDPHTLLPDSLQDHLKSGQWMVMPLDVQHLHFGLMVFEMPEHLDVEQVRLAVSTAVRQALLSEQQQHYTETLEQQVQARTLELEQEIQVRVNAEKALRLINQQLQVSSVTDPLTGIYNRAALDTFLEKEWLAHAVSRQPMSVLLCDIDFFKQYNDTYGHLQGDRCLREVARTLEGAGRNGTDFLARYGGEEFILILPHTDLPGAKVVAERLVRTVREQHIEHRSSGVAGHITISVGVATAIPGGTLGPAMLVDWADQALYQAKKTGRDRFMVFAL